ncbi:MAG: hypothetical protein MUO40_13920, partial [Anaerolineaceae bacterium]|nr:hypothetical protein [Anaerolineaceae bacterium]
MLIKKRLIIRSIEEVKTGDKEKKIEAIDFLGNTIGVSDDFGLETDAMQVLKVASSDNEELVRKSANEALEMINKRRTSSVLDM